MIRIALYLCPQTVLSSLSMADDAFRLANQLAGEALFALQRVSVDGQPVQLGYARLQVDGDLQLAESADLLLIPATGSALDRTLQHNRALLAWLTQRPLQQQLASDNYADLCPEALAALETDRWSGLTAFQRRSVGTRTGS